MPTSIQELVPGDYVRVRGEPEYHKVRLIHGVRADGSLLPANKGGFAVTTESGRVVSMFEARSYHKKDEIEK